MGFGEGLGCSGVCAKYILFLVNFFVFCCGAVLLGLGIALLVSEDAWGWFDDIIYSEDQLDDPLLEIAVYVTIAVGGLLFVVGFFGCCGACKESKCMLTTYVVFVILILLLQLTGAILAIVFKTEVDEAIETSMKDSVQERYGTPTNDATTRSWDEMQIDWECCGSVDHDDYMGSRYFNISGNEVPESCCVGAKFDGEDVVTDNYELCKASARANNGSEYHTEGCYEKVHNWVDQNTAIVIGVLIGLGVLQLAAACLACCLKDTIVEANVYM